MSLTLLNLNLYSIPLLQADSESTRMIHEAYQFLTAKKKKRSELRELT